MTHCTVVIYCADPRVPLWDNIQRHILPLHIREDEIIVKISLLGGVIHLAYPEDLKAGYDTLLRQIRDIKKELRADRIILVSHDCGYYRIAHIPANAKIKKRDLARARARVQEYFRCMDVFAYYAEDEETNLRFVEIGDQLSAMA